jgi:hypothetical protein
VSYKFVFANFYGVVRPDGPIFNMDWRYVRLVATPLWETRKTLVFCYQNYHDFYMKQKKKFPDGTSLSLIQK